MFKDPFPQPRRPKKSGSASRSDKIGGQYFSTLKVKDPKARIIVMVGLLVMLGFATLMLKGWAASSDTNRTIADEPTVAIGSDLMPRITSTPTFDPAIGERITDRGPEARRRWPEEAAGYLLHEVQYSPTARHYARNLLPLVSGSYAQIREDSRNWRLRYFTVRGKLESVEEQNYEDTYGKTSFGEIGQVKRGRILVPGEEPFHVTFITDSLMGHADKNELRPEVKVIEDGWVRIRGIVVKNFIDATKDGEEVPSVLMVATQVQRDYEIKSIEKFEDIDFEIILDDPSLGGTDDGKQILSKLFPRPMFQLLKYAEPRAGEQGQALREKEQLTPGEIDAPDVFEAVIGDPAKYRGQYFGGKGIIVREGYSYGISEVEPNDAGVEEYFEGWIATDRHRMISFVAPGPLMHRSWKKNTRIRWGGYFYKSLGYSSATGRRLAPVFVLTELEQLELPKRDVKGELYAAFGALAGVILLVWIIVRDDKTKKEFRRRRSGRKAGA